MHYQVVILSQDAVFARMLELEFAGLRLKVKSTDSFEETENADVLILDLDSASAPASGCCRKVIGFSRRPAMSAEDARSCSMILRRPFRMSLLRREVLTQTGEGTVYMEPEPAATRSAAREIRIDPESRTLHCGGSLVTLSPQEFRVLQCLMENRGRPVSRARLAERIGQSDGNKADVYICYLRRKTDGLPGGRLIRTVRGQGYCITDGKPEADREQFHAVFSG